MNRLRRAIVAGAIVASGGLLSFTGAAAVAPVHWAPPKHLTWYWQLQGTVKVEPVMVSDFDGFDNTKATVAKFHTLGQKAICYIDVGTAENFRSDYAKFPASVLGATNGWPGERWLDVRQISLLAPIMNARFAMCKSKGFDAVEPDNMDGYSNSTGFTITAKQQAAFDRWIAASVHGHGMAVFQKNDVEQSSALQPYFDGVIDEQCNQYSECGGFAPYLKAGKPVLNAEYQGGTTFCAKDKAAGIMGALFNINLNGSVFKQCP